MTDSEQVALKTALYEIAATGKLNFRFTANQNVILADIRDKDKKTIEKILKKYRIEEYTDSVSALRKNSMACVALSTCPLAFAEAQRYLPSLISKIEPMLQKNGLQQEDIILRMTGCPNGCARSYIAEIGFIGTALGKYNLQLGGDHTGSRLNKVYKESLDEDSHFKGIGSSLRIVCQRKKSKRNVRGFRSEETIGLSWMAVDCRRLSMVVWNIEKITRNDFWSIIMWLITKKRLK